MLKLFVDLSMLASALGHGLFYMEIDCSKCLIVPQMPTLQVRS